ncbi:MAG TPA: lipopolysaccharide biosynthesis protein [Terriglobia bacterium]|nr:lipopolysaccharide biosynthesis protein [Candidatus Acidoferrum sp.]HMD85311.1 lipopolysaccharide biosynthesis protein [Terriglobia bacterium]
MMGNVPQLNTDEALRVPPAFVDGIGRTYGRLRSTFATMPAGSRLMQIGYSFADQALAIGCTFLANVVLARTQTKEEYGLFALSYSVFTFLAGLHNSAILEPCTVYGSGRYRNRFSEYLRLMVRANAYVGLLLTMLVLLACLVLHLAAPQYLSRALLGLGVSVGVLLSGAFLRRMFYLQRQPGLAARASLICFLTVACVLWLAAKAHFLNGFSVFVILALGWIAAGLGLGKKLALGHPAQSFLDSEPGYWLEHWKYSKWVLSTAFVFQFTAQGYYWLVAGFLSVKRVAELRVMQMLVAPIDQVFIALSFLVIPALAARYASNRMGDFLSLAKRYGLAVLSLTALFALAVRLAGKLAMHLLYAGKFDDLAPMLYIVAFLPLIMGIGNVMSCALNAAEKPKLVFRAYLSSGAATLLGGIPLVIHSGLRGAVYGLLFSATAYTAALAGGFLSTFYKKTTINYASFPD